MLQYGLELALQVGCMLRIRIVQITIGICKASIILLMVAIADACSTTPQLLRLKFT